MSDCVEHLSVEQGPEKGRKVTIPPAGARIGRSSHNDICFNDPVMSRFHCRFYFKPGEGLWAEDLGSANQTLLNGEPLRDSRVRIGDRLTLGDTVVQVLSEAEPGTKPAAKPGPLPEPQAPSPQTPEEEPAPAPPIPAPGLFQELQAKAKEALPGKLDFRRPGARPSPLSNPRRLALVVLMTLMAVVVGAIWFSRLNSKPNRDPSAMAPPAPPQVLGIRYERVQANAKNIFRYAMDLRQHELSIQIDDLQNQRHVAGNQKKKIDPDVARSLAQTLFQSDFFEMKDFYRGLSKEVCDSYDLTLTMGRKTHRVRVINTVEPDAFKTLREAIEEFGRNELGLAALAMAPEKLREMAQASYLLARSLYDQRKVKHENLSAAIRSLKETEWYLETIEPKPDFYKETVALKADCERELQEIANHHLFLAERAIKLQDWNEAALQLRALCEKIPDRTDDRHKNAKKKLIDVERHLKKK